MRSSSTGPGTSTACASLPGVRGPLRGLRPGRLRGPVAELVHLVHDWRRFPFRDPEIPVELLPDDWAGRRAQQLFEDRRARWGAEAATWFKELEASHDA